MQTPAVKLQKKIDDDDDIDIDNDDHIVPYIYRGCLQTVVAVIYTVHIQTHT